LSKSAGMPDACRMMRKDRNRKGGGIYITVREESQVCIVLELETNCQITGSGWS